MKRVLRNMSLVITISIIALISHNQVSVQSQTGIISGTMVDQVTGIPLRGEVGISFNSNSIVSLRHATVFEQGFVIDQLPAGQVHLVSKLDGYATEHKTVNLAQGEFLRADFSLLKVKRLRGVVRRPTGFPLAGAIVRVVYSSEIAAPGAVASTYQWETGETKTDELGSYILDVHPQKAFVLETSHPDFLGVVMSPRGIGANVQEVVVNVSLKSGVSVSGRVTDAVGSPVAGARMQLVEDGARRRFPGFVSSDLLQRQLQYAISDTNGNFRFEHVQPTRKMLIVAHPAYGPFKIPVELTPSRVDTRSNIILAPRG